MAISLSQSLNNARLSESQRQEVQAVTGAILDALQAIADNLDGDSGVNLTTYRATLDAVITD